jgi:lysozyme
MTVNAAAIDLITEFEGFVDHWYQDPVGIWTVCYGHTDAAGTPFYATSKDKVFSKAEGREILAKDLRDVEAVVRNAVRVAINENQIGALVSFTFNVGEGNFTKSTLLKKVNAGMFVDAATEFARWNKAKGKVLKGLTRRRAAEADLFSRPVQATAGASPPIIVTQPVGPPTVQTQAPRGNGRFWGAILAILLALGAGLLKLFGVN